MTRAARTAGGILAAVFLLGALLAGCGDPAKERHEVRPLSPDSLHAWMRSGRSLVLLDTRPDSLYRAERIGGAAPAHGRSIPDLREVLPVDHTTPVVFYNADGTAPATGTDAARDAAERFGFPLVYRLEGGLDAWIDRGFGTDGMRPVGDTDR